MPPGLGTTLASFLSPHAPDTFAYYTLALGVLPLSDLAHLTRLHTRASFPHHVPCVCLRLALLLSLSQHLFFPFLLQLCG